MRLCITVILIGIALIGSSTPGSVTEAFGLGDKISVQEIVSQHLESIGPASARAAAGSRIVGRTTEVTFRSRGIAKADGSAVLASDGAKSMVTMKFDSSQYPYEKIGF